MTLVAGARLGPYELLSPLAEGGMGEVWTARDTRLDRIVAIECLMECGPRFEPEARAIAALNHPNVCHILSRIVRAQTAPTYGRC
jgi:eukaryotic-like serine/threonine-protein kinase